MNLVPVEVRPSVTINGHTLEVELARTAGEQQRGLSNHGPLMKNQGMLFVFSDKQTRQFWMKEMLFPLDIIWIDDDRIVKIDKNLPPEGRNPKNLYSSGQPVNFVLEVNAGWADSHAILVGAQVERQF